MLFTKDKYLKVRIIMKIYNNDINFVNSLSEALEARELIKITVLKNAAFSAKEIADDLANELNAEVVATIGHKIVLYRFSNKKGIKHIEF